MFEYNDIVTAKPGTPKEFRSGERAWIIGICDDEESKAYRKQFPDGIVYLVEFEGGLSTAIPEGDLQPVFLQSDWENIRQCMAAILNGPAIEDWEFCTRLGFDRAKLREILSTWSNSKTKSNEKLAINNCMNEVAHGINFSPAEWSKWFTVPRAEIADTYRRWRSMNKENTEIK